MFQIKADSFHKVGLNSENEIDKTLWFMFRL